MKQKLFRGFNWPYAMRRLREEIVESMNGIDMTGEQFATLCGLTYRSVYSV